MAIWLRGKDRNEEYRNVLKAYKYVYQDNKCREFKKDGKKKKSRNKKKSIKKSVKKKKSIKKRK